MKKNALILFVSFLCFSCTKTTYEAFIQDKLIEKLGEDVNLLKAAIIIPNQGCTGCISESEGFLRTYYSEMDSVLFVMTKIVSKKILKMKLGDSIFFHKNVYVDSLNVFTPPFFHKESIYPSIIYLNHGVVTNIEYQSPNSIGIQGLLN